MSISHSFLYAFIPLDHLNSVTEFKRVYIYVNYGTGPRVHEMCTCPLCRIRIRCDINYVSGYIRVNRVPERIS